MDALPVAGLEERDFEESVAEDLDRGPPAAGEERREEITYLRSGRYDVHLNRWREHFLADQLLVVGFEATVADPRDTLEHILRFAGVDENVDLDYPATNARARPPLADHVIDRLHEHFAPSLTAVHDEFGWSAPSS